MNPPAGWQVAVEVHPPEWRFPAEAAWVAGWIAPGPAHLINDVRAWIDGRPVLGLFGLPKPGLDERLLGGRPGPPCAGFVFLLRPHRGAAHLRFEACDAAGQWHPFFATTIRTADDAPGYVAPAPLAAQLPALLPALLKRQHARPDAPLAVLADDVLAAALAEPLDTLPNPPFHGALEEPTQTGWLRYGRLSVTGWLAHRTARITRVTAIVDAVQESTLLHGLPRTDIGGVFADLPGVDRAQFVGHVDLPVTQPLPALLKIFAELDNGEKHLVFARRFQPRIIAGADLALPPRSRRIFARAVWALRRAAPRFGVPVGSASALLAAVRRAWCDYAAEAPAPRRRLAPVLRRLPAATAGSDRPLRILVATHNLNFEGAPWFIFELARHLAAQPGVSVRVVSPADGPLRRAFAELGLTPQVLPLAPAFAARSRAEFDAALRAAGAGIAWDEVDLVIANTMVCFWAVHLARAAGKPALLYVHESTPVRRFFAPMLDPALFPLVEEAFRDAARVVYTADSTRLVHEALDPGNGVLLPSWVDVGRIDAFAAAHDRAALRRKHGLDPEAVLLVNIGSLCERKGQHIFLRAIELLRDELRFTYPGKKIHYVMVGARPGPYFEALRQESRLHGLDGQVFFVPETGDIFDFYRLADIFVCTSFEESFPRVLLESAAFRLPIVSTHVNGIAEMLAPDEAWLHAPGDRYVLAEAMKQALAAHFAGDTRRAERARAAVLARYHEAQSLPQHVALARAAAAGRAS